MAQYPGFRPPSLVITLDIAEDFDRMWHKRAAGAVLELPVWPESKGRGECAHFGHVPS